MGNTWMDNDWWEETLWSPEPEEEDWPEGNAGPEYWMYKIAAECLSPYDSPWWSHE